MAGKITAHAWSIAQTAKELDTDPAKGLSFAKGEIR